MPLRKINPVSSNETSGQKYSAYSKDFVCSSGVQTLDYYIGGGFCNRSVVLLEDSGFHSHLSRTFIRNFVLAGKENGDRTLLIGKSTGFFKTLFSSARENAENGGEEQTVEENDKLKIAWRYEHLPKIAASASSAESNHLFSEEDVLEISPCSVELGELMNTISSFITGTKPQSCRIILLEYGSVNFFKESSALLYLQLLFFVRSILVSSETKATCLVNVSNSAVCDRSVLPKLRHLSDYNVSLVSFDQLPKSVVETNTLFSKDHLGFLNITKNPYVGNIHPLALEDSKFGVKKRKQQLILERLHLPPELSDTANRTETKVISGCHTSIGSTSSINSVNKEAW